LAVAQVALPRTALVRRARRINRELARLYPDAHIELNFTSPLELLVAAILSARTRVCHARRPACGVCGVAPLCPSLSAGPTDEVIARRLVKTGLGLAGIGIGTTVVPITSAVLAAVPPERSGMAASAANTSREIGAVTGVAILGSLVVSQLRSSLTAQLHHLGIPAQFQALVINALETGQIPKNTSAYAGFGKIVQEVISAAYTAFRDGLHAALYLSAGLMLGTGLLTFLTLRSRPLDR
jgi:hypothetical protein